MIRETLAEAGYKYITYLGNGEHILQNEKGTHEVWFSNKYHASYGLIYKNTHLEFARQISKSPAV